MDHFADNREVSVYEGTSTSVEKSLASLFQPDTLIHDEYFEVFRRKTTLEPEKELMLAVFEDAVWCFQTYAFARDKKRGTLFREAEDWILKQNDDWLFSFENICEILGFNPGWIRQRLLRRKEMKLEERPRPKAFLTA